MGQSVFTRDDLEKIGSWKDGDNGFYYGRTTNTAPLVQDGQNAVSRQIIQTVANDRI
jgi:hypothetical protein